MTNIDLGIRRNHGPRLPLLLLQSNRKHDILMSGARPATPKRRRIRHRKHRYFPGPLSRSWLGHWAAQSHHWSQKAMVAVPLQLHPNMLGIRRSRSSVHPRNRNPGTPSALGDRIASTGGRKPGSPVPQPGHDRDQHRHGDGSVGGFTHRFQNPCLPQPTEESASGLPPRSRPRWVCGRLHLS